MMSLMMKTKPFKPWSKPRKGELIGITKAHTHCPRHKGYGLFYFEDIWRIF